MFFAMLSEAWQAMGANRMRTALTMLGMVIGVAAVVLMLAIGQGAQDDVKASISSMGGALFIVLSGSTTSGGARTGGGAAPTLTVADGEAISELSGVEAVAPLHLGTAQLVYGPNNWSTAVLGTTPGYLELRSWPLIAGAPFTDSDIRSATRVALVGQTVVENLFSGEDPVGKTIRIKQNPFIVVGVLAVKGQSLDGRDQDDTVIIPWTTAHRKLFGAPFPGAVRALMVQAAAAELMPSIERSMTELLRQRHHLRADAEADFFIRNLTAVASSMAETTRIMSLLLGAIASISLLVGGIGIMNIMLVSVTERTREIGIRIAIGARPKDIRLQFLLEAIIISSVGCLIGVLFGVSFAMIAQVLAKISVVVTAASVLLAFGVAALVGIFFGFYPANKAAKMEPISALRYE